MYCACLCTRKIRMGPNAEGQVKAYGAALVFYEVWDIMIIVKLW